jgi:hypothetical protein
MGLFKKRTPEPGEVERIKAEMSAMAARLDRADADKHEIGTRVQELATRLDTPIPPPHQDPPPPPPPPGVTQNDLHMLRAHIQRLNDRLDQVDARVTAIATELANQLTEISHEIDALAAIEPAAAVAPADPIAGQVVEEILDAQLRLANEQARYQIAFRQDLAELAERLRRS